MSSFIDRLLSQGSTPLLEQVIRFTAARHRLLAENIANVDTPGYVQKDLSLSRFERALAEKAAERERRPEPVSFDDLQYERQAGKAAGILAHDGNNRSMEQLAADQARNALMHNVAVELLRKQFQQMDMALKERVT